MFHWLKKRLVAWLENCQQREIDRLRRETLRLKEEIERTTGEPIQWSQEDQRLLAEKAKGIDPETLKKISLLDPNFLSKPESETDSTENRD